MAAFQHIKDADLDTTTLKLMTNRGSGMTQALVINSSGNVGIGTDSPISELSVHGKISITNETDTPDAPTGDGGYIYTKSDGKLYWRSADLAETDLTGTGTVNASSGTFGTLSLGAGSITDSSGAISFADENLSTTGTVGCGAITSTGVVTGTGFTIGSAVINETELETIDGVIAGTAAASKALVLDTNKDIGTIRNLTIDGVFTDGNYTFDTSGNVSGLGTVGCGAITSTGVVTGTGFTIGSAVINETELETIDGVIAGTAAASKALVLDTNKDIGTIRNLTIDGVFTDGNYTFDTSGNVSGLGTVGCGAITSTGDMTIYDDTNNADTSLSIGTSATEALVIQVLNGAANKTAEEIKFISKTASGTANHGKMTFSVDENNILEINDSGITVTGTITGDVIGNVSGTVATVTGAAQTSITSVGTLTALQVDNINIDGNTISSTAGTDLNITPLDGQQIVLDGTINVDAGVITGATSITSTAFVGALTGDASGSSGSCTGNAATATVATTVTVADTTDTTCSVALFESATGNLGAKSDGGLTYNAGTGMLTATGFTSNGGEISYSNGQNATLSVSATDSGTAGKDLTISAGSTTASSGNIDGGDLILKSGFGDGTGSSIIGFHTSTATSDDAVAERMRIHTNGNVGIGTTTPIKKLHLKYDEAPTGNPFDECLFVNNVNSTTNSKSIILFGQDESTGNRAEIFFNYDGDNSNSNNISFGFYDIPDRVNIYKSTTVGGNYYLNSTNGLIQYSASFGNINLLSNSAIASPYFVAFSDSRIKKEIVEIDDDECLSKVRLLKPCKYKYIDEISKGSDVVYGFIAQEVRAVLPYAVTEKALPEAIPNVYKGGVFTDGTIVLPEAHGLTENGNIKLKIKINAIDIVCPYTIVNETTLNIDTTNLSGDNLPSNDPMYDEDGNELPYNIFVYGTVVDDFHVIRKDAIWTTGISALQEVDRQLQAEKVKTATLESQVADLLARVTALENP